MPGQGTLKQLFGGTVALFVGLVLAISMQTAATQSASNFTGTSRLVYDILFIIIPLVPVAIGVGLVVSALRGSD